MENTNLLKSSIVDMLAYFSSHLFLVKNEDAYYIVDNYYIGGSDNNHGVLKKFNEDELKNGVFSDGIFDSYTHGKVDFYLFDELTKHYKVDSNTRMKLETHPLCHWGGIAKESGYDELYKDLKDPCRFLEGAKTRGLLDTEIAIIPEADKRTREAIDEYEKRITEEFER